MDHLKKNYNTAIMLITHDMGVVCELADDVAVMYMGNIIESGSAEEVLDHPTHPYTRALLKSIPVLGRGASRTSTRSRVPRRIHTTGRRMPVRAAVRLRLSGMR